MGSIISRTGLTTARAIIITLILASILGTSLVFAASTQPDIGRSIARLQQGINHPFFTSTPVTSATVGQPYSYDVDATDPDGTPLIYLLIIGPEGMTMDINTGLISWTPSSSAIGTHPVEVRTGGDTAQEGTAFQNFDVTVTDVPIVGQFWELDGNANTSAGTNFLGTTDNQDLVIKTNGAEVMRIDSDGSVGIGTTLW